MKRIILFCIVFIAFLAHAHELENDTINCGNNTVIISLPEKSIKRVGSSCYEEGFIRFYNLNIGSSSYILVQYGALMDVDLPQPDNLLYEFKLGNVASSISFSANGKYFRYDKYFKYAISVIFCYVTEEERKLANYILDNLTIIKSLKQIENID